MFTEQVEKLEILVQEFAKIPGINGRLIVDTFKDTFGQCRSDLRHNGRVEISTTRGDLASTTDAIYEDFNDATLTLSRYPHKPSTNDTSPPKNGWALNLLNGGLKVCGPTLLCGPVTMPGGGATSGSIGYGKATTAGAGDATVAHVLGTVHTWGSYIDANKCDKDGTLTSGTVRIYLFRTHGSDPNVRVDDVVPYLVDDDDNALAIDSFLDGKVSQTLKDIYVADPTSPLDYTAANGIRGWRVPDGTNGTQNMNGGVEYAWKSGGSAPGTAVSIALGWSGNHIAGAGSTATSTDTTGITINNGTTGITLGTHDPPETASPTTGTEYADGTITEPNAGAGHSHTITEPAGGTGHSHVTSGSNIAALLTVNTPNNLKPAGLILLKLQRVN